MRNFTSGQKDGCLALIHIAKSIGIQIVLPVESDLIRPMPLYGYQEHDHHWIKHNERDKELTERMAECQRIIQQKASEYHFLAGAKDANLYEMRTWTHDAQAIQMAFGQPG